MAVLSSGKNLANTGFFEMFNEDIFHVLTISSCHVFLLRDFIAVNPLSVSCNLIQLLSQENVGK